MRFTHRWDHHLQGYYVNPGDAQREAASWSEMKPSAAARSAAFNRSVALSLHWAKVKRHGAAALRLRSACTPLPMYLPCISR